jgi:GAF domain-containing protein
MLVSMEPVPETARVMRQLSGQGNLDLDLGLMAEHAQAIVPDCVGLSLGLVEAGLTFTLVSTEAALAGLDAAQYLDGGPCVAAAERGEPVSVNTRDLMDEERWQMFSRASAARGVASTLSLPILHEGRVVGGVNLYASSPGAFEGRHEALAEALGASAEGAITNADLSFITRQAAAEAPARLEAQNDIDMATGMIAARLGLDIKTARVRLRQAAARAGITEAQAARALKDLYDDAV